jgi:hypothetical protein
MLRVNKKQHDEKASDKAEAKEDNTPTGAEVQAMSAQRLWRNT